VGHRREKKRGGRKEGDKVGRKKGDNALDIPSTA
jgi:hypothetical protein